MKLLFLSYWGYNDPLTTATVLPHVRILAASPSVESVTLCTIERGERDFEQLDLVGVECVFFASGTSVLNKVNDFIKLPKLLLELANKKSIDKVICRGTLAGSLGYLAFKKTGIPFYVESYEPHAEYMRCSGVWSRWSLQYILQRRWQTRQLKYSAGIMTVSTAYSRQLVEQGIDTEKIKTVPCAVDLIQFKFDQEKRNKIRTKLGFTKDDLIGIYVGKFGGLYYDEKAFRLFKRISRTIKNSHIFLLTQTNPAHIKNRLDHAGVDISNFVITHVEHQQVPDYLSAADFAICLHRSHAYSNGFSPVKNGEYWANGLPLLIPEKIGDDSAIVANEEAGAVYSFGESESIQRAIERVYYMITHPENRTRIPAIAQKYRPFSKVVQAYQFFELI